MTDNSPATDEQIAAWENETHIMPSDLYTFILSLIARIRAETAKNSGEALQLAEARVAELELIRDSHSRDTLAALRERDALTDRNLYLANLLAPDELRTRAVKFISEHDPFGDVFSQHELAQLEGCVIDRVKEAVPDVFDDLRSDVQEEMATARKAVRISRERASAEHADDISVDRFAEAMKEKMKWEREQKGRYGWNDPSICSSEYIASLLIEHIAKGNAGTFEDVANFAMMMHQRGDDPVTLRDALASPASSRAEAIGAGTNYHIVFDGFPAPDGPRFVELENDAGRSISAGEWKRRADGLTELVIPTVRDEELRKAVRSVIASLKADYSHDDDGYGAAESLERALLQQEGE